MALKKRIPKLTPEELASRAEMQRLLRERIAERRRIEAEAERRGQKI